jgi:hypothetical protein
MPVSRTITVRVPGQPFRAGRPYHCSTWKWMTHKEGCRPRISPRRGQPRCCSRTGVILTRDTSAIFMNSGDDVPSLIRCTASYGCAIPPSVSISPKTLQVTGRGRPPALEACPFDEGVGPWFSNGGVQVSPSMNQGTFAVARRNVVTMVLRFRASRCLAPLYGLQPRLSQSNDPTTVERMDIFVR